MAAEGVPGQAGILGPQGGEAEAGQPAPLVRLQGVRLLHPAQPAAAADLVVDGERLLAV